MIRLGANNIIIIKYCETSSLCQYRAMDRAIGTYEVPIHIEHIKEYERVQLS